MLKEEEEEEEEKKQVKNVRLLNPNLKNKYIPVV
jgi:hypothetical protein